MTFINVNNSLSIPQLPLGGSSSPGYNSTTLDAVGEYYAGIFQMPVTDTITDVGVFIGVITANGDLEARIETVDFTSGYPSGTLWDTNTNATQTITTSIDNTLVQFSLTSPASVSAGDWVAVKFVIPSGSTFRGPINQYLDGGRANPPYLTRGIPSDQFLNGNRPIISINFGSGGYVPLAGSFPISLISSSSLTAASTPRIMGNVINLPFSVKVDTVWFWTDFNTNNGIVELYDSDGTTVLATATVDDKTPPDATPRVQVVRLDTEVTLSADTNYRITMKADVSNIDQYFAIAPSADIKNQNPDVQYVYRTNANVTEPTGTGDWTDTTQAYAFCGILIKEIDTGGAGGGLLSWTG